MARERAARPSVVLCVFVQECERTCGVCVGSDELAVRIMSAVSVKRTDGRGTRLSSCEEKERKKETVVTQGTQSHSYSIS
jgi:hypothetical protein